MKFCPLRSNAEKEIECSQNCAFYTKNNECAIKNIGEGDFDYIDRTIRECTDSINEKLENL